MAKRNKKPPEEEATVLPGNDTTEAAENGPAASSEEATTGNTEGETTEKKSRSIIDPKYRNKYKGGNKDWAHEFIDAQTQIKSEDGKQSVPSMENLFKLARANNCDETKLKRYEGQLIAEKGRNPGRIRMTVGNMLRGKIRQYHGLTGLDGEFVQAGPEALAQLKAKDSPTHNPDGTKIKVEKPAETASEGQEAAQAA